MLASFLVGVVGGVGGGQTHAPPNPLDPPVFTGTHPGVGAQGGLGPFAKRASTSMIARIMSVMHPSEKYDRKYHEILAVIYEKIRNIMYTGGY